MDNEKNKYILSSVHSALSILNLYYEYEALSIAEVAKLMDMNRSTAFRCLMTLESLGFLKKTDDNRFRLGLRIFTLGQLAQSRMELISSIHPLLVKICEETGETANLVTWGDATNVVVIDKALSRAQLKMDTALGLFHYAHLTSAGKAILAFENDTVINNYLRTAKFEAVTPSTITDIQRLLQEINLIRQKGFAQESDEVEIGLSCLAVPILEKDKVIASISVSGPSPRIALNKERIIRILKETVSQLQL